MSGGEVAVALTPEEYLGWEERQPGRHELVGGRVYAMTGATRRHSRIVAQLLRLLAEGAERHGCTAYPEGRKLRTPSGSFYYPDVMVVCGEEGPDLYEVDASLLVEVLSPSTRSVDKREKLNAYGSLPSLTVYLLVEPDIRRVESVSWEQGSPVWTTYGPGEQIVTPYGEWPLDALYDAVQDRPAGGPAVPPLP